MNIEFSQPKMCPPSQCFVAVYCICINIGCHGTVVPCTAPAASSRVYISIFQSKTGGIKLGNFSALHAHNGNNKNQAKNDLDNILRSNKRISCPKSKDFYLRNQI